MHLNPVEWVGRALRKAGAEIPRRKEIEGTWIDVGAYHGEITLEPALRNPALRIYAFEPNLRAAAKLFGKAPNYIVIPMAVAERDGCAEFHLNAFEASSSLLPLDQEAVKYWVRGELLREESTISVPTIRLDTFMEMTGTAKVDFLKIDAQGADLAVIKSAGGRIKDIARIEVEVSITPLAVYVNSPSKEQVVAFLENTGFSLIKVERQSCDQEENLTFARP